MAAVTAGADTVTYDFNTAGQYTGNFTANNGTVGAGNNFTQSATGGLNGSGSLTASASDNNGTSVATTNAINLNSGMLTLAGYFTPNAVTGNASGPGSVFQLGLTANLSGSFGGTAAIDSLTGRVVAPTSNGGTGNSISFTTSGGVAAVGTLTPVQISLTAGNTYYLTISITQSSTNATPGTSIAFSATESLYNASSTGALGSLVATYSASFTNSAVNAAGGGQLYGDATARFGFRGAAIPAAGNGVAELGTGTVDNLSVTTVPEPSTWAVLAGGAMVLGVALRRRSVQV